MKKTTIIFFLLGCLFTIRILYFHKETSHTSEKKDLPHIVRSGNFLSRNALIGCKNEFNFFLNKEAKIDKIYSSTFPQKVVPFSKYPTHTTYNLNKLKFDSQVEYIECIGEEKNETKIIPIAENGFQAKKREKNTLEKFLSYLEDGSGKEASLIFNNTLAKGKYLSPFLEGTLKNGKRYLRSTGYNEGILGMTKQSDMSGPFFNMFFMVMSGDHLYEYQSIPREPYKSEVNE